MKESKIAGRLENIPIDRIRPNPDNPRMAFRQRELDELQESIRRFGVQVPIAVYKDSAGYVLIDGERRWKCCSKLNFKYIPAIVQPEPSKLQNLLLMFNIHALREQWDLLTVALRLPTVIELLKVEIGREPNELDIANQTGLARGVIRRCRILMDLPDKYKQLLLTELRKPKTQQKISEDFFIELEKALKTVERAMPGLIENKNTARNLIITKYQNETIKSIIELRKIPRIARAEKVGADVKIARRGLTRFFSDPDLSIESVYASTVADHYSEKDLVSRIDSLILRLKDSPDEFTDDKITRRLKRLIAVAKEVLEAD